MEVLRFHSVVGDQKLRETLKQEFPDEPMIGMQWIRAWNYPPVEWSLNRLLDKGLVTAYLNHGGHLVGWKAVNPLDALTKI